MKPCVQRTISWIQILDRVESAKEFRIGEWQYTSSISTAVERVRTKREKERAKDKRKYGKYKSEIRINRGKDERIIYLCVSSLNISPSPRVDHRSLNHH